MTVPVIVSQDYAEVVCMTIDFSGVLVCTLSPTSCTMTQGLGLSLVNTVYRKSRDRFSFRGDQKTSAGVQYLKKKRKEESQYLGEPPKVREK